MMARLQHGWRTDHVPHQGQRQVEGATLAKLTLRLHKSPLHLGKALTHRQTKPARSTPTAGRPYLAGSWKMNGTSAGATPVSVSVTDTTTSLSSDVARMVTPPFSVKRAALLSRLMSI